MAPPSCLPSWWDFNRALLQEIKALAETILPKGLVAELDRLELNRIPVQSFSELIVDMFAGSSYFPILDVLDSSHSNANHRALAELAHMGILRAIVSTNFDTLIERAFREASVALRVRETAEDFSTAETGSCQLLKIHGSVTSSSTIVDTVGQKLRGLGENVRAAVSDVFQNHVLVLGFSGADLGIKRDYLPFSTGPSSAGITWLLCPGSQPTQEVEEVVSAAGGSFVYDTLPDFFAGFGVQARRSFPDDISAEQDVAYRHCLSRIRQWVSEPHIGPLVCAAFCADLFARSGDRNATAALLEHVATLVPTARSRPVHDRKALADSGMVYGVLARNAARDHRLKDAISWCWCELQYSNRLFAAIPEPLPETRREACMNMATPLINISAYQRILGDHQEAERALDIAHTLAKLSDHHRLLSRIDVCRVELDRQRSIPPADLLDCISDARGRALKAGVVESICDLDHIAANVLVELGEYDCALEVIAHASPYASLSTSQNVRIAFALIEAGIQYLRASTAARHDIAVRFSKLGATRGSENAELALGAWVEARRQELLPARCSTGMEELELACRRALIGLEFRNELNGIPACYHALCARYWERPRRLRALALGYLRSAERIASTAHSLNALYYMGVSLLRLGEIEKARIYLSRTEQLAPSADPRLAGSLKLYLAEAESKLGNSDRAVALLNEASQNFILANDPERISVCDEMKSKLASEQMKSVGFD